jgi:hydrogen peroxide-dependent heme synthase
MSTPENLPAMPLTIEGASLLHQMLRVRWPAWRALDASDRAAILNQAASALAAMEVDGTAVFSMLGHKGDIMLVHFRKDFTALNHVELALAKLRCGITWSRRPPIYRWWSWDSTNPRRKSTPRSPNAASRPTPSNGMPRSRKPSQRQRTAMHPRLFRKSRRIPSSVFIPWTAPRRAKNWYQVPMPERQRQMQDHGEIGRRYAGKVKQIISGSIGFDDWEWGVDLFADDPLMFKKLIYEMRFDEVSAVYALFGTFYVGRRVAAIDIGTLLDV